MPRRGVGIPTLLNMMSSRPKRSTAPATVAATSAFWDTSQCSATAAPSVASISATVSLARSRSMSAHTTDAPSSAKRRADARPTPEPAPVMMAIFPSSHAFAHFPSSSVRSARVPVGHASIAVEMLSTGSLGLSISTETAEGPDQAPAMTGISAGVNRYSFSALPRRSLYCVSGGRCPMIFFTTVMQLGHVESECG